MAIIRVGPTRTYTTINSAISAASGTGEVIVIDPGTYNENVTINKWVHLRGKTNNPENGDIIIHSDYSGVPIAIDYTPSSSESVFIEGVKLTRTAHTWSVCFLVLNSNSNLSVYLNRCIVIAGGNEYPLDPNSKILDKFYVENCYVQRGYSHVVYGVWTNMNEVVISKTETNDAYFCYLCSGTPDILDTVATPTVDYGPAYGTYYNPTSDAGIADLSAYIAVLVQYASFNVWAQGDYIFKPTTYGVEVYNYPYETLVDTIEYSPGNTGPEWANDDYLYISTTDSGVLRSPMSSISGAVYNDLSIYKSYPDIASNNVNYIHGAGNYLNVATTSGSYIFDLTTGSGVYIDLNTLAEKCYQLSDRTSYYIYDDKLKTVYNDDSTYVYTSGDGIIPTISGMNDLHVVGGTQNLILLATTDGAVVIEENKGSEASSRFKYYYIEE